MKGIERGWTAEINVTPLIDVLLVLLVIFLLIPHRNIFVPVNVPPRTRVERQARVNTAAPEWLGMSTRPRSTKHLRH